MLSILLTILKIIGLILLAILGLVLLVLLAVLLVPVRYEAEAAMKDNQPTVKARVSWLLRVLGVNVRYGEDGIHYRVKIGFFSILDSDKPKKEKKVKKAKVQEHAESTEELPAEPSEPVIAEEAEPDLTSAKTVESVTESRPENKKEKKKEKKEKKKKDDSVKEKKSLQEKLEDLKTKKEEITEKIRTIKAKVDEVLAYLQSPRGKKLLSFLKKKVLRLLRHLKPKALKINGRIGLSDPATTGQILGITYMLYPLYSEHIHLTGEFEEEIIDGDFYIKGRIRLGTLVLTAIQIILNQEVRMWIKKATGGNRK